MKIAAILVLVVAGIYFVNCEHLIMGDANNKQLIYHRIANYHHIPLKKRVKDFYFSSPDSMPINVSIFYSFGLYYASSRVGTLVVRHSVPSFLPN